FNHAGTGDGRAIDFQNMNAEAGSGWGPITIGTASEQNVFDGALPQYLRLQFENGTSPFFDPPTFVAGASAPEAPTPGHFDVNLDAEHNTFGGVAPTLMDALQRQDLESKTFHKLDDSRVGLVSFGFNYPPTLTSVNLLSGANEDTPTTISVALLVAESDYTDFDGPQQGFRVTSVVSGTMFLNSTPTAAPFNFFAADTVEWLPPLDANGTINAFEVLAHDGDDTS